MARCSTGTEFGTHQRVFDLDQSDLTQRSRDTGLAQCLGCEFWHIPAADVLFLHRELGRLRLLAVRLKARVNVQRWFNNQPLVHVIQRRRSGDLTMAQTVKEVLSYVQ